MSLTSAFRAIDYFRLFCTMHFVIKL